MKITIWVHKSDVISGEINRYYTFNPALQDYVQIQISKDEFVNLEDREDDENLFRDEEQFLVDQYNRNRNPEDHISRVSEMPSRLQYLLSNTKF